MEAWVKEIVEQARKKYGSVEVKKINNNLYLYKATSTRVPGKKYPVKVTGEYIGKITPHGLIEAKTRERTVHEYANAKLLSSTLEEITPQLRECFPEDWRELAALATVRTIRNTPIKYTKDAWEKLYTSTQIKARLSRSTISEILRSTGADWAAQSRFYQSLIMDSSTFYYDLSSIFSHSVNLRLAEKGYNKEHLYLDQINFALLFSQERRTPVMLKPMPGSTRDVKTLRGVIDEFQLRDCVIILDRGFYSWNNIEAMLTIGASFIQPLRRNSKLIDYGLKPDKPFTYRGRGILYTSRMIEFGDESLWLHLYEDVQLRGEEHSNLIKLTVDKSVDKLNVDGEGCLEIDESRLGKISILTDLGWGGERIYGLYKEKEDVELAFDAMKNELENDKCYLGDDDAVRGYFFVSFLSLYLYFRVLEYIRLAGLTSKVSVDELLFLLSKVYVVVYGDGRERFTEVPARVKKLVDKMGLENVLP
jgi:transposase